MSKKNALARFFRNTILKKGETITNLHDAQFTKNVRFGIVTMVKKQAKKKDYLEDILQMKAQGMSFKNIGKTLGMSPSYVSKLFKDATKGL